MQKQNIIYIHLLRAIAIIMVIVLHTAAPVRDQLLQMHTANWLVSALFDALSRCGVPIFVMISGALLLAKDEPLKRFYAKRFSKIIIPFLFWGLFYLYFNLFLQEKNLNIIYAIVDLFKGPTYYHMWYIYMIIGLYLFAPFFGKMVRSLSKKELEVLLIIWFAFTILIPHLSYQIKFWLDYEVWLGIPIPMGAYLGYFILGYYLSKHFITSIKWPVFTTLYFITSLIIVLLAYLIYTSGNAYNSIFIVPESPFIILTSSFIFIGVKLFSENKKTLHPLLLQVSILSFGIYLIHPLVLEALKREWLGFKLDVHSMDTILSIPTTLIITLVISFSLTKLITLIPFVKKIV